MDHTKESLMTTRGMQMTWKRLRETKGTVRSWKSCGIPKITMKNEFLGRASHILGNSSEPPRVWLCL
jgi:hypothetical protein